MTSVHLSHSAPALTDHELSKTWIEPSAYYLSVPLTKSVAQKIFDLMIPFQNVICRALEKVTFPESHEELGEVLKSPIVFFDPNKSGEFLAHHELRLAFGGRKIRMICPKTQIATETCLRRH